MGNAAQNHALQTVQIVEAVAVGFFDGGKNGLARIVADDAPQLAQGKRQWAVSAFLESLDIGG